jgi:predicted RNase H-like nuclease (RuvC/YqgF family)
MAYSSIKRSYTIVGIDPGTTIGVAMLDLDGRPIDIFSSKNYSVSDAVARIISLGKPLIVASDVTPTPSMVKRISSIFSSLVPELDESLSLEEKIALTKGAGYKYKNAHERDALAACVNAFKRYKKKFSQVQKKTPAGVDVEEVKAQVVKGVSISAAIDRLISVEGENKGVIKEERQEEKKSDDESENILRLRRIIKQKDEKIEMLEELTTALKAMDAEKELKIRGLNHKLESMRSERRREMAVIEEIRRRDNTIERLREELNDRDEKNAEQRRIIEELKGKRGVKGGKRIKLIKSFCHDAILDAHWRYGLKKGDVVFLEDGSGGGASTAELLAKKGISAVIYGKELSHFATNTFLAFDIPTFSSDEIPLLLKEDNGDFAFVDQHLLYEKVKGWKAEKKRKEVILFR